MNKRLSPVEYGKQVIDLEAKAVEAVKNSLTEDFDHAVKLILSLSSHGHIITSGIGKAGFIAQKVSATFASVGFASFFLHPAEAIHGDIGRFTKSDLALILSNSGETPEILQMLPSIKRIGCPIISITATKDSELGKHSDVALVTGKISEAGPLGLAPTTSTTVMLALGDALAMTVLHEKGLTQEEYAFYHPGGMLGRSLLLVKDVMRTGDELCVCKETMLCKEVLHQITITKNRPGAAAIVDDQSKVVGIFTDGDFRRCMDREPNFLSHPVKEFMGKTPKSISPDKLASEASRIMTEFKIDELLVVDNQDKPIGLIDIQDLLEIKL